MFKSVIEIMSLVTSAIVLAEPLVPGIMLSFLTVDY